MILDLAIFQGNRNPQKVLMRFWMAIMTIYLMANRNLTTAKIINGYWVFIVGLLPLFNYF